MTHRADVAGGRDIVGRWCVLAEQRLEYLTELFETGRWRRYHSEHEFLENIKEAKTAVEAWRDLVTREANRDNSAIDMSWLGRARVSVPGNDSWRGRIAQPTRLAPVATEPRHEILMPAEAALVTSAEAPSAPDLDTPALDPSVLDPIMLETAVSAALATPVVEAPAFAAPAPNESVSAEPALDSAPLLFVDIDAIERRYPLLRNAM